MDWWVWAVVAVMILLTVIVIPLAIYVYKTGKVDEKQQNNSNSIYGPLPKLDGEYDKVTMPVYDKVEEIQYDKVPQNEYDTVPSTSVYPSQGIYDSTTSTLD